MTFNRIYNRILQVVILLLVTLSLAITSSLAFTDVAQHKTNEFGARFNPPHLTLHKYARDGDGLETTETLEGAQFELWKVGSPDTQIGAVLTTDVLGQIMVDTLLPGTYYFYEKKAPVGHDFDLDDQGEILRRYDFKVTEADAGLLMDLVVYNRVRQSGLEVAKVLKNDDGSALSDKQKLIDFEFTITFKINDLETSDAYDAVHSDGSTVSLKSGDSFNLKHGESLRFNYLPEGLAYTVEESFLENYKIESVRSSGHIGGAMVSIVFTNTFMGVETGMMSFKKEYLNFDQSPLSPEQAAKLFKFAVNFEGGGIFDYRINGGELQSIEDMQFIELKHDDVVVFENLPIGQRYGVKEVDYSAEGIVTLNGTLNGVVQAGVDVLQTIYNVQNTCTACDDGRLIVSKIISAEASSINTDQSFEFKISFEPEGSYDYKIGQDGQTQSHMSGDIIRLKHNEEIIFEFLPQGTNYTVIELPSAGYVQTLTTVSGTIQANQTSLAKFVNIPIVSPLKGRLEIEKRVVGTETDRAFDFILEVNGTETPFSLKHNETATFELPVGTIYKVTEKDYLSEGFTLSLSNGMGVIVADQTITVLAENTYHLVNPDIILKGEKTWVLGEHSDVVPEAITVNLYDDLAVLIESKVVKSNDSGAWLYEFTVPQYHEDGTEIKYSIQETPIDCFSTEVKGMNLVNTYVKPALLELSVEKRIEGTPSGDVPYFEFSVEAEDGAPIMKQAALTIHGLGTETYDAITFTQAGTYTYKLSEKHGFSEGYTYDKSIYTIIVTTIEQDHEIVIESIITQKDGVVIANPDAYRFTNIYTSKEPPVEPEKPVEPENPIVPEKPGESEKPEKPSEPEKPVKPAKPGNGETSLVQTGIGSSKFMSLAGLLLVSGCLLICIRLKQLNDHEYQTLKDKEGV